MNTSTLACAIALALLVAGCASAPPRQSSTSLQSGLAAVSPAARLPSAADSIDLSLPLSPERAVQVAFANNPQVRAALARLDAAYAERVQAGLVGNPMLSMMALRPEGGGRFQLEYGLMQSLYDVLTRSRRIALADADARQRQADVLLQLVALAQDTRQALVQAWFAQQALALERALLALDEEAQVLSRREVQRGIAAASGQLAQQSAHARQAHETGVAESALVQARSALAAALGLASANAITLPAALPVPALANHDDREWQAWAANHRPDAQLASARLEQAQAAHRLESGAVRATLPSAGLAGMREANGMAMLGPELQVTLPVFDSGQARTALADARVAEATHQAEAVRRLIPLELERALATVLIAQDAVAQADRHLQQQRQLQLLVEHSYRRGIVDRTAQRTATRERVLAEREHLSASRTLWLQVLALERAAGREMATDGRHATTPRLTPSANRSQPPSRAAGTRNPTGCRRFAATAPPNAARPGAGHGSPPPPRPGQGNAGCLAPSPADAGC